MASKASSNITLSEKNYVAEASIRNHFVVIDEPVDLGGDDNAPTPVEYLLTAIGSCVAITLRMYAQRKEWDLGKINVNVHLKENLKAEGIEKVIVEEISFENDISSSQREKLLEIAGKCPVATMVKNGTKIESKIK